jgi:hypothetical protein
MAKKLFLGLVMTSLIAAGAHAAPEFRISVGGGLFGTLQEA